MSKRGQGRITLNAGVRQAAVPLAPLAQALALMLAAGGVQAARPPSAPAGSRHGGAAQAQTQASGRLPDGSVAGIPTAARQQTQSRQQLQQSLGNLNRTARPSPRSRRRPPRARLRAVAPAVPDQLRRRVADRHAGAHAWLTHAEAPKSSTENGRSTVTINQTADRAILNWQTFNVGRDTTVDSASRPSGRC